MPHKKTTKVAQAPVQTHYEVLGLDPRCSTAEIKKAYQKIALENHTDKLVALDLSDDAKETATALFIAANAAQEVLLDEASRKTYDLSLALKGIALGDRFGNTEAWVESDDESDDNPSEEDEEEEEKTYAKVYQGTHAGLSWDDGILTFRSLG
jgi:DnaJ-class molecular chaperone